MKQVSDTEDRLLELKNGSLYLKGVSDTGGEAMEFSTTLYDTFMYPLEKARLSRFRKRLLGYAQGEVLEIGAGTGVNLKYLPFSKIDRYVGLDLNIKPLLMPDEVHVRKQSFTYEFIDGNVEELPFEDDSFDTVVFTLVFCSVHNPLKGLQEIHRVLKPRGRLIFIEHILPNKPVLRPMFELMTPYWSAVAENCHLNRDTVPLIKFAGFKVLREEYFFKGVFVGGAAVKKGVKNV